MASEQYDIITVGGGLGSSALAKVMAERGKRVLILEREREFKDRVRGEFMTPWGVAETHELGIYKPIIEGGGNEAPYVELGFGQRDFRSTTPQQLPALGFSHPEMQEIVLSSAKAAGAEVRRGVTVVNVKPGSPATVAVQNGAGSEEITTRLVVAADGRTSSARQWAGFEIQENPKPFFFAGLLLTDVDLAEDQAFLLFLPPLGRETAIAAIGGGRYRAYVGYPEGANFRLQGKENISLFLEEAKKAELVKNAFDKAKPIGPLASFRCGDFWVDHPYKDGVVLLGDAASTTDPAFGQGLSTTVRDARVLRDHLLSNEDWDKAGHAYATEHDRYSVVVREVSQWFRTLFLDQGPDADSRRARAMPLVAKDPTRVPDHLFSGPDLPADESVKLRFFGGE